jgi:DNA polymerase I-like protein with 3'-5' exonuclease and polymerase domains
MKPKGTPTGRLNPPGPNIQNVPIRTEEVRHIREGLLRSLKPKEDEK